MYTSVLVFSLFWYFSYLYYFCIQICSIFVRFLKPEMIKKFITTDY